MIVLVVIIIIIILYYYFLYSERKEDHDLSIKSLCEKYGYIFESFEVETEDNYILTIHRIQSSSSPDSKQKIRKFPVLLVHGLGSSSMHWLTNGTESSLGFYLANEGYDVWMPNLRGSTHSRNHRYLSTFNLLNNYFDFTFHEMGYFDLPAIVDSVLQKTGKPQVYYIGMSQGTTSFFVMASTRPEYNDKIKGFVAMAPAAYMNSPQGLWLRIVKESETFINFLVTKLYVKEIRIPHILRLLVKVGAKEDSFCQRLSFKVFQFFTLTDESLFDKTKLPIILANFSGVQLKTFLHCIQISKTGVFKAYDYGVETNQIRYGQSTPPQYDLSLITTPTCLMWAPNDFLTTTDDINRLTEELPNVVRQKRIPSDVFGHTDFCFANNINDLVYDDVMQFLAEIEYYNINNNVNY